MTAQLTNVPWRIDAGETAAAFRWQRVSAPERSRRPWPTPFPCSTESELHTLQEGEAVAGGNMALIAAGTGLGEALLHNVDGRFVPSPTEGGHADFAARNERDIELLRELTSRYGRAEVEHVVSGRGLVNIHRVTHRAPCDAGIDPDDRDAPAADRRARRSKRPLPGLRRGARHVRRRLRRRGRQPGAAQRSRPAASSSAAASRRRFCRRSPTGASCARFRRRRRSKRCSGRCRSGSS